MNRRREILALFLLHLGFMIVVGEANFHLSAWSLHLRLDVFLVLFAALYLRVVHSLVFTLGLGLIAGAFYPMPPGSYAIILALLWFFLAIAAHHLRREHLLPITVLAMLAQLLLMLFLTLWFNRDHIGLWPTWQRFIVDALINLSLIALFTQRWIRLNLSLLYQIGWDIEADPKSA